MLDGLKKVGTFLAGAAILGALTLPAAAQDFHGQSGHVFYPGMHAAGFASHSGEGRNLYFHGRSPRMAANHDLYQHHNFGNDGSRTAQNGMRHDRPELYRDGGRNHFHANHLPAFASRGDVWMRRGSGVSVVDRRQADYDVISNYSGSTDVYRANGGTYIAGYGDGDGGDNVRNGTTTRPRAKVIDIATMHDSCSHENGVCVIRP